MHQQNPPAIRKERRKCQRSVSRRQLGHDQSPHVTWALGDKGNNTDFFVSILDDAELKEDDQQTTSKTTTEGLASGKKFNRDRGMMDSKRPHSYSPANRRGLDQTHERQSFLHTCFPLLATDIVELGKNE